MTPGPAVSHHCHSCKLHPPTPAPVYLGGEKKNPNICRMINRTTSLQIRGWMSLTLYYLNTSTSQDKCSLLGADKSTLVFINEMTKRCSHLLPSFITAWQSLICMFSLCCMASPRARTLMQLEVFSSSFLSRQTEANLGYLVVIFLWCHMGVQYLRLNASVLHNPFLSVLFFVSVLNESKSNCYQTKSQKRYYPVIQSWQLHQSWMVTVIAAKSHFV